MINGMKFRIFGMYIINLLVIASINIQHHQNITTYIIQGFNSNLKVPNIWLAVAVLVLYFIVNRQLDQNVVNIHFNRLRVMMLILILVSFITEFVI